MRIAVQTLPSRATEEHPHDCHPGGDPRANIKTISHRCYLREVAFEWELSQETIYLPLGCLQLDDEQQARLRTKDWQAWLTILDYDKPALCGQRLYAEFCGLGGGCMGTEGYWDLALRV